LLPIALCRALNSRRAGLEVCGPLSREQMMASKTNPFTFLQQVRSEATKIVWPTRRETAISTVMVFVMVVLASLFFLAADQVLSLGVSYLLGIGR
jgi:preprotein translocase subunit SecE